jgi:hypothetical protein
MPRRTWRHDDGTSDSLLGAASHRSLELEAVEVIVAKRMSLLRECWRMVCDARCRARREARSKRALAEG